MSALYMYLITTGRTLFTHSEVGKINCLYVYGEGICRMHNLTGRKIGGNYAQGLGCMQNQMGWEINNHVGEKMAQLVCFWILVKNNLHL